jgi:hypothetical protein
MLSRRPAAGGFLQPAFQTVAEALTFMLLMLVLMPSLLMRCHVCLKVRPPQRPAAAAAAAVGPNVGHWWYDHSRNTPVCR